MKESKNTLTIVIVIIVILLFAGAICLVKQERGKITPKKDAETEVSVQTKTVAPAEVGAGKIGETKETLEGKEIVILPAELGGPPQVLPPAIFNSSGTIKEIKKDSLIVEGTGYNFADQKPRDLTLKFAENTVTNAQDGTKQIGFEGLTHLKVGDSITFESPENIRGKTEFEVTYVNKF
jgi:hypothetical protein